MPDTPTPTPILVIEDDQDIREAVQEILASEGYRVLVAENGKVGLELLRTIDPPARPGLILLDLMMPVMNGWEFLRVQKADPALREIPVTICSAIADREKYPEIVQYIRKPLDLEELLEHVARACGKPPIRT